MSWTEDQIKALGGSLAEIERTLHKILMALESRPAAPNAPSAPASTSGGATLPNYGKNKGAPIYGADTDTLEYYASGCRRTLADQSKERFHGKERAMLAAIEAEIARQQGGGQGNQQAPDDYGMLPDEDVPFITRGGVR